MKHKIAVVKRKRISYKGDLISVECFVEYIVIRVSYLDKLQFVEQNENKHKVQYLLRFALDFEHKLS